MRDHDIYNQLLSQGGKEIPDTLGHLFAPAVLWIKEWYEYWIELPGVDRLQVGTEEKQAEHGDWFRLHFENQLGLTQLQAITNNRHAGPAVFVEVISPKFDSLDSHYRFYKSLLDELFQRAARLPFSIQALTQRGIQEAVQPPTPLFTLHYLYQNGAELSTAMEIILANPHRLLVDEDALVGLAAVKSVDADVVLDIFQDSARWVKTSGHPLARKLGGFVPSQVWQHIPEETHNTPENRFVLHFLHMLLNATDDLAFQPWWGKVPKSRREHLQELRTLLQQTIAHPLFEQVGEQRILPLNSQVLLRRDGYRQILALWQQFHQARQPLFQPMQNAIDLRSVDELYEYWVFFTLATRIGETLSVKPQFELRTSDEHGLNWLSQARFGKQGTLVFNRTFAPNRSRFVSYSTSMRPDFTWVVDHQSQLVFDAKFSFRIAEWETADTTPSYQTTIPKLDNLYQMHTYRDALGLKAAVIVYPGKINVFFDLEHTPNRRYEFTLDQLLKGELSGIGSLSMQPGS